MKTVLKYFVVTYAVTWTLWIAAALMAPSAFPRQLLFLPGTIAPAIVAICFTARSEGSGRVRAMLDRLFAWRVNLRWYVFATTYYAAIRLTVALVYRFATGTWPAFGNEPWFVIVAAILVSTAVQAGEEIGWRGYALPRLAERLGFSGAGVLIGVVWAVWHLPLFFIPATDSTGRPFLSYLVAVTAVSVAMTWLYANTGGSLLLTMLMHASVNNTAGIVSRDSSDSMTVFAFSASPISWLTMTLLWIGAAYFMMRMPDRLRRETGARQANVVDI